MSCYSRKSSSSSSSCRAASTDIPDPLSPLLPSFIASGRSSGLHPVSSHSCCMYVRAGRPAFACPYTGVHRSTSLMSSPLLLQQCPACLVRLTWIVSVMGGRWPYSWCFVGYCRQDLFNIARNILVLLSSSFFFSRFVSVQVVHPYSSIDPTTAWKKLHFILSVRSEITKREVGNEMEIFITFRSDFHMIEIHENKIHYFTPSDKANKIKCEAFFYTFCLILTKTEMVKALWF